MGLLRVMHLRHRTPGPVFTTILLSTAPTMPDDPRAMLTDIVEEVRQFLADLKRDLPEVFRDRRTPKDASRTKRIPYRGGYLEFRSEPASTMERSTVEASGDTLLLRRSPRDPRPPGGILEEWYRGRAREVLADRVEHWAGETGVRCRRISVKDQRTLWGSCSPNGNLYFNWRLIMAPAGVLDYVVIHELCHLREMNHSKRFWRFVSRWCPDHKVHRRWLRKHGRDLKARLRGGRRPFAQNSGTYEAPEARHEGRRG